MSIHAIRSDLALFGGPKAISHQFRRYNPIGTEEAAAVQRVMESGVLSQFLGAWHPDFYGGPLVREFERSCEQYFGVKHAVTMNSLTSGLIAAVGAISLEPGDEVIVPPWTMCATATAVLQWNGIPVFADIDRDTFCLLPASVEANISRQTKAIIAADIFGHPADTHALLQIAARHNLKLISDTAQAPGALDNNRYAGTLADIGGFSLNYHKHIHTGEGAIMVTNDDALAERMRLIRNHAEAVVGAKGEQNLVNLLGFNFRLGEIESAIGIEQLKKLKALIGSRQSTADRLSAALTGLPGLQTPVVRAGCTHAYYIYPLILDTAALGVGRETIKAALEAEGVPGLIAGYQNVHLLPLYQQRIAYGSHGFPWNSSVCKRDVNYAKGICPIAETLHDAQFLGILLCMYDFSHGEVDAVAHAFAKVWSELPSLRG